MSRLGAAVEKLRTARPPRCFLHVPKCAGTSLHEALEAALPPGAVAPRRMDPSLFCGFSDFHLLNPPARALVAVEDHEIAELASYRFVSGHFSLLALKRIAPQANIATVLREPRARMLSGFMFMRLDPVVEFWGPYGANMLARMTRSPEAGLSDPLVARATDNQLCRLVLHGDPRVPDGEFVAAEDVAGLAEATLEQLDRLGFVGILEFDDIWGGMSDFFGLSLEPARANVSGGGDIPEGALPFPPFDMRALLELIDRRTSADRLVYGALLERRCGSSAEARRIADAAFATELVRFGDVTGSAATRLDQMRRKEQIA